MNLRKILAIVAVTIVVLSYQNCGRPLNSNSFSVVGDSSSTETHEPTTATEATPEATPEPTLTPTTAGPTPTPTSAPVATPTPLPGPNVSGRNLSTDRSLF